MEFKLERSIEILERTPEVLSSLLSTLPDDWTRQNEGGESWSAYDVMGHLIHGEDTDWIPRARTILFGSDKRFVPFDRFAQFESSKGKSLEDLLQEFTVKRKANLKTLKEFDLKEEHLAMEGIHPDFGEVTLRQLLSTWTVHDLSHIAQIARVMGKQYKEATGPWQAYIPMLQDREA